MDFDPEYEVIVVHPASNLYYNKVYRRAFESLHPGCTDIVNCKDYRVDKSSTPYRQKTDRLAKEDIHILTDEDVHTVLTLGLTSFHDVKFYKVP